ncbi:Myc-type, basic helix-loop-helix domain-containing protein [Tanacetum coccineum]
MWLDGEMYYGQLEEILELTYIGNRKVVLFRCKWFDTINPKSMQDQVRAGVIPYKTDQDILDEVVPSTNPC